MAVFDDQKTEEPLVPDDNSPLQLAAKNDGFLSEKENGIHDDQGSTPLNEDEQRSLAEIEAGLEGVDSSDNEGNFTFNNDDEVTGSKSKVKSFLRKRGKKKLIFGSVFGSGFLILILLIILFMNSLKLPHFVANISAYEFARLGRDFSNSVTDVTEEKIAIDSADETFSQSLKAKYTELRSSTWGKLDKYRPEKVLENMKGTDQLEYIYRTEERKIKIPGFSNTKEVLDGIKINGEEIRFGQGKWYDFFGNRADRLEFNGRLTAQLQDALADTNTLVRGRVAQKIRDELGIKLQRWERLSKTYNSAAEAEAEQIKQTYDETNTKPKDTAVVSSIEDAETAARNVAEKCDKACLEQFAKDGGKSLSEETKKQISLSLNETKLSFAAGTVSTIYKLALPLCMIYEGSVEKSGATVQANSDRAVKTWYTLSAGAHQQLAGNASASQAGGLSDELGDISSYPSELKASGKTVNADNYSSPQANSTQDYSIFDALLGGIPAKIFNEAFKPSCPYITDPKIGLLAGGLEIGATIASGGELKAGEETLELTTTQLIKRMLEQTFSKEGFKDLGKQVTKDSLLIVGGTLLAKVIVFSRMGNTQTAIPNSQELGVQAPQGAILTSNDIDRKQLYGGPMTAQATAQSNLKDMQDIAFKNSRLSIYDRYINPQNPTSALTNTAISFSSSLGGSITQALQKLISRIGKILQPDSATLGTILNPAGNKAAAAVKDSNFHIVQWGWTDEEENKIKNNPDIYSPLNNAETLERSGQLQALKDKYDKCFTSSVADLLSNGDIVRDSSGNIVPNKGFCSPNNLGPNGPYDHEAFKYRIYMRYQNALDQLGDIQNPTEDDESTATTTPVAVDDPITDAASQDPCPSSPNISEAGIVNDAYRSGTGPLSVRMCWVQIGDKRIMFNTQISGNIDRLFTDFMANGYTLDSSNGDGYRTYAQQAASYAKNPGNFAPAGRSNHEYGTALDVRCSGGGPAYIYGGKGSTTDRGLSYFLSVVAKSPCLDWIHKNSTKYNLILQCDGRNKSGSVMTGGSGGTCEPWHLSPTGA